MNGTVTTYDRHGIVISTYKVYGLDSRERLISRWRKARAKFRIDLDGSVRRFFPLRPEVAYEVVRWDSSGGED